MNGLLKSGVFAVCMGLAAAAGAAEGINPFGIKLPERLEDLKAVAYEDAKAGFSFRNWYGALFFQEIHHYDDPQLGYSLAYASPAGTNVTVYVYDLDLQVPTGTRSELVVSQFRESAEAVRVSNRYASVEDLTDASILSPHFLQAAHVITTHEGMTVKSYTLLRGQNGHFIKIRITGDSPAMEGRLVEFLKYLSADLGVEDSAHYHTISTIDDARTAFILRPDSGAASRTVI